MPKNYSKKTPAKTKTVKSGPERNMEYYNSILMEEIRSQMKTVIDGVEASRVSTNRQFTEFRKEVNDEFEIVKTAIRHNSNDIKTLGADVQVLKTDVQEIRVEMKEMEKRLSDKIDRVGDRVDNHEVRITNLETVRL